MKAMILREICNLATNPSPLEFAELPIPVPHEGELLLKVSACGVCHTELDEIEGRMPPPLLPVVPGHQVVGSVIEKGQGVKSIAIGERVGVAWINSACGHCRFCSDGNENLCKDFTATGRDVNGGYAEYMTVREDFVYRIPEIYTDVEAAPLLCAGAIGYRSLRLAQLRDGERLGLTGFGASGHLVIKIAKHRYPNSCIYVFARSDEEKAFALQLGAVWAGDTEEHSPVKLSKIIDTTPVWKPLVEALKNLDAGGRLVINAIRKEEIDKDYLLQLNYPEHLWLEKEIKSVANVSRTDVQEFLDLAAEIPIKPEIELFELKDANTALSELKMRKIRGAKVLKIG